MEIRMGAAKKIDNKGRITIGRRYADAQYFVNEKTDGSIVLVPAVTIPAREAWLHNNPVALARVKAGVHQAARGETAPDPQADEHGENWLTELDASED